MARSNGLRRGTGTGESRLRQVVRRDRAVLAIDLGEHVQAAVPVDHEAWVLARKTVMAKAYEGGRFAGPSGG